MSTPPRVGPVPVIGAPVPAAPVPPDAAPVVTVVDPSPAPEPSETPVLPDAVPAVVPERPEPAKTPPDASDFLFPVPAPVADVPVSLDSLAPLFPSVRPLSADPTSQGLPSPLFPTVASEVPTTDIPASPSLSQTGTDDDGEDEEEPSFLDSIFPPIPETPPEASTRSSGTETHPTRENPPKWRTAPDLGHSGEASLFPAAPQTPFPAVLPLPPVAPPHASAPESPVFQPPAPRPFPGPVPFPMGTETRPSRENPPEWRTAPDSALPPVMPVQPVYAQSAPTAAGRQPKPRRWVVVVMVLVALALVAGACAWWGSRHGWFDQPPPTSTATPEPDYSPAAVAHWADSAPPIAWTWTPQPGDVSKASRLGIIVVRGNDLILVGATGAEQHVSTLTATAEAIVPARIGGHDCLAWTSGDALDWASIDSPDTGRAEVPTDATLFGAGDSVAAADGSTVLVLTPSGFQPVSLATGAAVLGADDGIVWSTSTGTDLNRATASGSAPVTLAPPSDGWVMTRAVAASWGRSLTLWQRPGWSGTLAAVHDLGTGAVESFWTTGTDWDTPDWGLSRMSVTSGTETAWLSTNASPCSLGDLGIPSESVGSALLVSSSQGAAVLDAACSLIPTPTPPIASTADGGWLFTPGTNGAWSGTRLV